MELYGNWQTRFWSKSASFIVNNHFSLCVPHPHILQSEPDKAAHANNRNPAGSNVSLNASD
jgi:hypothetical protein